MYVPAPYRLGGGKRQYIQQPKQIGLSKATRPFGYSQNRGGPGWGGKKNITSKCYVFRPSRSQPGVQVWSGGGYQKKDRGRGGKPRGTFKMAQITLGKWSGCPSQQFFGPFARSPGLGNQTSGGEQVGVMGRNGEEER